MNNRSRCAVVVTFRPQATVLENLAQLRPQVEGLVVVDNGSPAELLAPVRAALGPLGDTLIENGQNLGIAAALNAGVRWAKAQGFSYVLLFDQDSTVSSGFAEAMCAAYEAHPQRERVALVTPSQVEKSSGRTRQHRQAHDGGPLVTITSGSLMPASIFDQCGWFEEDLIIDCVDHEYCLRARSRGYTIAECREAVLLVAVGAAVAHQAFGLNLRARHYGAGRRYYMTRNRLVMVQRFWKQQPLWCGRLLQDMAGDLVKIALVETGRWAKMRRTVQGIYDAFSGRMGKVVDL